MYEANKIALILGEAFLAAMREAVREEIQAIKVKLALLSKQSPPLPSQPTRPYLTVKEAAQFSSLAPSTIRLLIRKRKLAALKIGRRVIIKEADLENFLEAEPMKAIKNWRKRRET
ncbi:MAG: helix-turn-helix domain-containing protein [Candidatus Binatia bacterium]